MTDADAHPRRPSLDGARPAVADSAFVSNQSYLVGDVTVAERASVWPFVCARGDTDPVEIGAETNVQEFSMIHASRLGDRVTVGHNAVVDDATIESDVLVGMQSAVLRGATVESNSIVAAGAVVLQGQTVPGGHLAYGTPAETRPLEDDQVAQIEQHWRHYVERVGQYKAEGHFE